MRLSPKALNQDNNDIQSLIIDMDGVLWKGEEEIGNLSKIFDTIRGRNYGFILATNNAMLSVEQYQKKLSRFNVQMEDWQIINSSQATAHYLREKYPQGKPVFIIGENGIHSTLSEYNFYHSEKNPVAVIVGLDRELTYEKLRKATLFIRSGSDFIGTNPDVTYPMPEGLIPGAGSILAALSAASNITPKIIGKPSPYMYSYALERLQSKPENTIVVGDRLDTDIAGAQEIGCLTGLVLSGVTDLELALNWKPNPNFISKDLSNLLNELE